MRGGNVPVPVPAPTAAVTATAAATTESGGGNSLAKSNSVMTDSTSSVLSGSSVSSAMISWQHVQPGDWNIEQVGSWLRSIGLYYLFVAINQHYHIIG